MLEKFSAKARSILSPKKGGDADQKLPENLSTLQNAQARLELLKVRKHDLQSNQRYSASYSKFRRQIEELEVLVQKFKIEAEFLRIDALNASDRQSLTAALDQAQGREVSASLALKKEADKSIAIEARLAPLVAEQDAVQAEKVAAYLKLKADFEVAMSSGDVAEEARAAEALSQAQKAANDEADSETPTALRIAALQAELVASSERTANAQSDFDKAAQDTLLARANLAGLDYDEQAHRLFLEYLKQWAAVTCLNPDSARFVKRVDEFGAGICSRSRFIFADQSDAYSRHHVAGWLTAEVARTVARVIDYELLAQDIVDFPVAEDEDHPQVQTLAKDAVTA